jgi:hypothetical protein
VLAGGAIIASLFVLFVADTYYGGFNGDDLMNLYRAWERGLAGNLIDTALFFRFSPTFRPVGALLYERIFAFGGFHPLPFRAVCLTLLLINLALTYYWARLLSASRATALIAAALLTYHGEMISLYVWTGLCYDILCFFFYYSAFVLYLRIRSDGTPPSLPGLLAWCALFILALGSKEMAVSLPVMLLLYEFFFQPAERRNLEIPLTGIGLTIIFLLGRVASSQSLIHLPAYRPHISLSIYLHSLARYLQMAVYGQGPSPGVVAVLAILAIWAVLSLRSRVRFFGGLLFLIGILPVAFIAPRGLDSVYVAAPGVALFLASLLTSGARRLPLPELARPAAAFALTLAVLVPIHWPYRVMRHRIREMPDKIDRTMADLRRLPLTPGTSALVLQDLFLPTTGWDIMFAARLATFNKELALRRIDTLEDPNNRAELSRYQLVVTVRDGHLSLMPQADFLANCLPQTSKCSPLLPPPPQ